MTRPAVSIVIPAYHERHFAAAFDSARAQTFGDLEILVCDDSPEEAIAATVAAARDPRVRYERNAPRRGFAANFTHGFHASRGRLVKFLNDDDRLAPRCVEILASMLEANPAVRLATSRRRIIDESGQYLADEAATLAVSRVSALMRGIDLGDFALGNSVNVIGEPSTAMFRRADLELEGDSIFRWQGRDYHCLADMSLWLRLLAGGLAFYAASPLSEFRRHAGQEQERDEVRFACLLERAWILRSARAAGFLAAPAHWSVALQALRARAAAWQPLAAGDAALADRLRQFEAEVASLERLAETA
jgi:O-antigen biosynthesis protein